ncbi:YjeJ family protein [Cedecea colo]|uniref:Uncharacterized protein n=1 Tax=Cedecea colo TaxID=2552946 RepID=A0ABX0VML8_9ENTR|nr:YjeJ family protein [Cedecea colo]NIY47835.1 hypothetical protein [Cedecea colo]
MGVLTGINTGIIKSPKGVLAIVLKASSTPAIEHLLYLPPDRLQELMFATCSCYRSLQMMHQHEPERIKNKVVADTQALSNNIPGVTLDEIHNPLIERRVTSFIMKHRQDNVRFLFFLQNDEVVTLELTLTQMEYVLTMLLSTVRNAEDAWLTSVCLDANDFTPFYTVDFSNAQHAGIKYQQFDVPDWKSAVFEHYYSIIATQHDGNITCGAIIKAGPALDNSRAGKIGQFLLQNNSLLLPYQKEIAKFDCMMLNVPGNEGDLDRLLRAHLEHRTMKLN